MASRHGGRLICFDLVDTYLETATEAWTKAGVADRIDMRIGPAADGLAALPDEPHVDLAFIDADKTGYRAYLDLLLPRLTERGAILVDNVLWSGASSTPTTRHATRSHFASSTTTSLSATTVDAVILTVGDGITMIRPRTASATPA